MVYQAIFMVATREFQPIASRFANARRIMVVMHRGEVLNER